jgi:chemotaxis protein methyltransferase CheR
MRQSNDLPLASSESDLTAISDNDFAQLTLLIREHAGIFIPPGKKLLLTARLSERMRALGMKSYADYHRHVLSSGNGELSRMTDAVCTNETRFFRDAEQLAYLEKVVLPQWLLEAARTGQPRRIRVWSAGCSTGEEAFTIAMVLLAKLPPDRGFSIEVLGTDISGAALDRARLARWSAARALEIPEGYRQRFFEVSPKTGDFEPSRDLRNVVRFQRLNLSDPFYPTTGRFDLVLCRNVLIYFDTATRAAIARRLVDRLTPDGLLLLGMSESLLAMRDGSLSPPGDLPPGSGHLRSVGPAVYSRYARPARLRGHASSASSTLSCRNPSARHFL